MKVSRFLGHIQAELTPELDADTDRSQEEAEAVRMCEPEWEGRYDRGCIPSKGGVLGTHGWDAALRSCGLSSHSTFVFSQVCSGNPKVKELEGHGRTCSQAYWISTIALKVGLGLERSIQEGWT